MSARTVLEHAARVLDAPIACEGIRHRFSDVGHDGGPAAFAVTCRCSCGLDEVMMLCAGRVHYVLELREGMTCGACSRRYENAAGFWVRIAPIDDGPAPEQAPSTPPEPVTHVDDDRLIQALVADMRARACSRRSIDEMGITLRSLARYSGIPLAEHVRDHLLAYLGRKELAPLSVRTYRSAFVGAFGFWAAEGLLDRNPAIRLPRTRIPHTEPNPLTTAEIQRLLDSGIRRRTRMMVLLAALQGLRAAEIATVRTSAIDWTRGTLIVHGGKGGTALERPLHPLVAEQAATFPRDGWWFPSPHHPGEHIAPRAVSTTLNDAIRRAGISGHRAHQLRAWHATELVAAGIDTITVQHSMRHADLSSLHKYTRPSSDRIRSAIELLPALTVASALAAGDEA